MRTLSFEKLLQKSINSTILILFKPFSFKKWLFLVSIAYLAGAMGGGVNSGGGGGSSSRTKESEAWAQENLLNAEGEQRTDEEIFQSLKGQVLSTASRDSDDYEEYVSAPPQKKADNEAEEVWQSIKKAVGSPLGVTIAVCLALTVIGLFLVLTWLGARFRFIWFESIVKNDASIKAPFFKYAAQGDSLFGLFVVLGLASLSALGLLAWWGYSAVSATGVMSGKEPGVWAVVGALAPAVLLFILLIIFLLFLALFIDHFVVSIMAIDGCGVKEGWRKFTAIFSQNAKDFVLFCLLMLGLAIATSLALLIVAWLFLLMGLLAGGLLFGLLYLLLVALLKLKIVFIIIAILIGVPLALAALVVLMCIPLPVAVFYRCFSLFFLTSLNCGYAPLALEEAAASPAPPPPPTQSA